MIVSNAAVFVNGSKKFTRVNVDIVDDRLVVLNQNTGDEFMSYEVLATAKEGMAWDVRDQTSTVYRITAQAGCGCGGMKPYQHDASYTGNLMASGQKIQ